MFGGEGAGDGGDDVDSWAGGRSSRSCRSDATCTMSGLSRGRCLAENILFTPSVLQASAPRPYTVSVGNATHFDWRSSCAAAFRTSSVSGSSICTVGESYGCSGSGEGVSLMLDGETFNVSVM